MQKPIGEENGSDCGLKLIAFVTVMTFILAVIEVWILWKIWSVMWAVFGH